MKTRDYILFVVLVLFFAVCAAYCSNPNVRHGAHDAGVAGVKLAHYLAAQCASTGPGANLLGKPVLHWESEWGAIEGVPVSDGDVPWTVSFSGATW